MSSPRTARKQYNGVDPRVCRALFGPNRSSGISDIAEKTGLYRGHIWRILSGQRTPGVLIFHKLAQALEMTMDELFEVLYGRAKR